tara:strand:- start:122 stop:616 length:495 start_codon:yes stop_codon:yes gene_type:complete
MSWVKKILIKANSYRSALWLALFMLLVWYVFVGHTYSFVRVWGNSMYPSYHNGESLIVERTKNDWQPQKNDIIIFDDGGWPSGMCKRIIGLEGDHIEFGSGVIKINHEPLLDQIDTQIRRKKYNYVRETVVTVPKGFVWVIGDNREDSWYGLVKIKEITGKVII